MVENITEKVVKRLVQVTSAMKQDGENRVGLIKSETAYKVSQKMAEASAKRPEVVGETLNAIAKRDSEIMGAVMEVMETEKLLSSGAEVDVMPANASFIVQLGDHGHTGANPQPPALSAGPARDTDPQRPYFRG